MQFTYTMEEIRMNKKTRLLIVIFLGVFGVHKFIDKDYKMGLIYLFTGGLCGIGWILIIEESKLSRLCMTISQLLPRNSPKPSAIFL